MAKIEEWVGRNAKLHVKILETVQLGSRARDLLMQESFWLYMEKLGADLLRPASNPPDHLRPTRES